MPSECEAASDAGADAELLQLAGTGDRTAFSRLYDRFSGVLFATVYGVLGNREAAEDVLQEVFLSIWEKAPLYDPGRGKALTWAVTMARNRAIDRLRGLQRRRRLHDEADREALTADSFDAHDSFAAAVGAERGTLVRQALEELPAEQRRAIELTFFESLTHEEAAARLNEPLGTVKARVRRGMIRLREALDGRLG